MKLSKDVPWVKLYKNFSRNLIPPITGCHDNKKEKNAKSLKIISSEARRRRALIFVVKHLLVDLYRVCPNYAPGAKYGPAPGVTSSNKGTKKENLKILLLWN